MPARKPKYRQRNNFNENVYSRLDAADKKEYAASYVRNNPSPMAYGRTKPDKGIGRKPRAPKPKDFKDTLIQAWEDRNSSNNGTKLNP